MKKIAMLTLVLSLLWGSAAHAQGITVWAEDFRDKSGLAVMIHLKTSDASICFKDVKIKTNLGEDSMISFGCTADNREGTFMVYPSERADITKLQIQSLTGADSSGIVSSFANLLKPQYSSDETTARIDISIASSVAAASKSGKLGIFGINLSSTYELNDGVRKMFQLETEQDIKNFYQDRKENGANLFDLLKGMGDLSILPFPKKDLNFLTFRNMLFSRAGRFGGNSFILMTPGDRKIVCLQYAFSANIPIENILPDIKSKFGGYRTIEKVSNSDKNVSDMYYVWKDELSYAVLSGVKRNKQTTVSKIYFVDIATIQAIEQEVLKQVNKQEEATHNQARDAFK